jgi:ferritin-like metal-binding protein YciE
MEGAMAIGGFRDLYLAELQEARSVEAILVEGLPKMQKAASDARLKQAFGDHLEATREHLQTVDAILKRLGATEEHRDQGFERMAQEAEKMAGMVDGGPLRDAALIASAQRIEHYEIAVYGTLATYARQLGLTEDSELLAEILEEEKDADELLSDIAEGVVNPSAVEAEAKR